MFEMSHGKTAKRPERTREARGPRRSCVGCGSESSQHELVRAVLAPEGGVVFDLAGGAFGRGAWVHPRRACLETAARHGFAKSFRTGVKLDPAELMASLAEAAERRALELLAAARGAGKLALGSDACAESFQAEKLELLVVARDARAAAGHAFVEACVVQGKALAFADKARLGAALGRAEVGVVAVLNKGLSESLRRAIEAAAVSQAMGSSNDVVDASTEG